MPAGRQPVTRERFADSVRLYCLLLSEWRRIMETAKRSTRLRLHWIQIRIGRKHDSSMALRNPAAMKAHRQYQKTQIETASPTRLIVLLYDGAIRFGTLALEAMQAGNIEEQHNNLLRVQAIVSELMSSVDREAGGDVALNLIRIYVHSMEQLIHANLNDDAAALEGVLVQLSELREAWIELDRQHGQTPLKMAS